MKQAATIIFIFIFIFHVPCYFLLFKIQQYEIRKEVKVKIKNRVPKNELTIFSFPPYSKEHAEIEWMGNDEFRYKGQMLDIVHQSTDVNGTIHYYCLNDKQEEILFAGLDEWIKKSTPGNSNSSTENLLKLFSLIYFLPNQDYFTPLYNYLSLKSNYIHYYLPPSPEIISPPPRLV